MYALKDDLPARVREARKNRGWTQKEMAERVGMSLRAYQAFESRETSPQGANLRAILRVVEMSTEDEDVAEATREEWPRDIRVFLDVMGAYLSSTPEAARSDAMHDITRRIFEARNK